MPPGSAPRQSARRPPGPVPDRAGRPGMLRQMRSREHRAANDDEPRHRSRSAKIRSRLQLIIWDLWRPLRAATATPNGRGRQERRYSPRSLVADRQACRSFVTDRRLAFERHRSVGSDRPVSSGPRVAHQFRHRIQLLPHPASDGFGRGQPHGLGLFWLSFQVPSTASIHIRHGTTARISLASISGVILSAVQGRLDSRASYAADYRSSISRSASSGSRSSVPRRCTAT